jgi:mRNA-degrading endonuclease RelE of RelBE toxin-antitoxin system
MEFEIEVSEVAEEHLEALPVRERRIILDAVQRSLSREADVPSRHRKLLRTNPLAAWELRVGAFRVFYNVEGRRVMVVAVGRKVHNTLFLEGQEYRL